MVTHLLTREQYVARPLAEVFAFFQRPENLAHLTPPWLHVLILSPSPVAVAKGARIDYALRVWGVRLRWCSEITAYDPPSLFIDEQKRGPYQYWQHRHRFTQEKDAVLVRDEVRYAVGSGLWGKLAHGLGVRWLLKAIFDYRAQMIREMLG